ncbi:hypothetical protein [Okeania sp. SIO2B3]|nr:hypothetical protein [Okeania sp. SIO2B3]NET41456.1 hypothetical protein [Okeania sp. SIO2B3]
MDRHTLSGALGSRGVGEKDCCWVEGRNQTYSYCTILAVVVACLALECG